MVSMGARMAEGESSPVIVIDTSTRYGGVALWDGGNQLASLSWHSARNHTAELMPAVEHVIRMANIGPAELGGVGVALGPGRFSALRVGISVAKGLALPLELPLVGVGTLEMEAYSYGGTGLPIRSMLDAGRGEVATATFQKLDGEWKRLEEEHICSPEEAIRGVTETTIFCGEGVSTIEEAIRSLGGNAVILGAHSPATRLWALGVLAVERLESSAAMDITTIQPLYLRKPSIGTLNPPQPVQY